MAQDAWEELTDWFVAYQAGDEAAVRPLFEALRKRIESALRSKGCKPEDVADLSQVILLKIHKSHDRYDPARPLRAWIVTIIERSLVDFWRSTRRTQLLNIDDQDLAIDESDWFAFSPENLLKLRDIERRLTILKPLDRRIVDLYAFEGLQLDEISKRVDLTVGAVKLRLHRCRHLLRGTELIALFVLSRFKL